MRIVIDMQGAQSESRFRGIGRYSISFALALARNRGDHEIVLALNGLFPDTIEPIRSAFEGVLPQDNIRVWGAFGPTRESSQDNDIRREMAEKIREDFLLSLNPDVIHVTSLFEGYGDDAVTSIGKLDGRSRVSVSLYDLIPLLNEEKYLAPNPRYAQYYRRKLGYLRNASIFLAISEFSKNEGIASLGATERRFVNVSTAIEKKFRQLPINDGDVATIRERFNITRPFVLYTGGADERKNLPRLIRAFAALPDPLRRNHQLIFAGKMPEGNVSALRAGAQSSGIHEADLRFTGYVSDDELVKLYNLCSVFVFPSWHEGFGLPALEAMACGAPVIAANTSSLPEVIGLEDALFDPLNCASITNKLERVLTDSAFCAKLRAHSIERAALFSWDECAKRALKAWTAMGPSSAEAYIDASLGNVRLYKSLAEHLDANAKGVLASLAEILARNKRNGLQRQLFLDVSELCQRDAATGVQRVVRSYLKWLLDSPPRDFRIEPVYATRDEGYRYARCFTQRFIGHPETHVSDDPIRWQRGDVFFGLDMQHHVQLAQKTFYRKLSDDGVTVKFLVHDLLPIQLEELFKDSEARWTHEKWLEMIATTDGAICVSKATADAFEHWIAQRGIVSSNTFRLAWVHNGSDIDGSTPSGGMAQGAEAMLRVIRSRPTFLSVATLEPRKRQDQIVAAMNLLWGTGRDVNLVLVGQLGWNVEALAEMIRCHPENGKRLFWLQGISDEFLEHVYSASTCLIAASVNEGFGLPIIEAARNRIPVIARDIPVFREVASDGAYYFNGDAEGDLAEALIEWLNLFSEGQYPKSDKIPWATWRESSEKLKVALFEDKCPRKQLLLDISELVQRDARTGIQRVVRSILKEWLERPPMGYSVEPVYATLEQGYRYARRFVAEFLGGGGVPIEDDVVEFSPGDIFLILDLQPLVQTSCRSFYQELRQHGVRVEFVVYDLLPIQMPEYFPQGSAEGFGKWLEVVVENDGAVCISRATAQDLTLWSKAHGPERARPLSVRWWHIGADVQNSMPTFGLPPDAEGVLEKIRRRKSFLMVGTVEPRKGHKQVLEAFDQLWRTGHDVNLVLVGKKGWRVDSLAERLRTSPEFGQRLFWLECVTDEYLNKIYEASSCLIAASYGEGFGLPLIEAAQHGLPILARNIGVFNEVAGEHAYYFDGGEAEVLADAVRGWLRLDEKGGGIQSANLPWLTWRESAEDLKHILLHTEVRALGHSE